MVTLELTRLREGSNFHGFEFQPQPYRRRLDNATTTDAELPWDAGTPGLYAVIQRIATAAADGGYDGDGLRQIGSTLRTFLHSLHWAVDEVRIQNALEDGEDVEIVLISMRHLKKSYIHWWTRGSWSAITGDGTSQVFQESADIHAVTTPGAAQETHLARQSRLSLIISPL